MPVLLMTLLPVMVLLLEEERRMPTPLLQTLLPVVVVLPENSR
jgi:hypothetical protein